MSLLMGLGKGLQGAGQAIGQGLYAYAMAMRDDERERMREASLEKRWAKEDARIERQEARQDAREAKSDARYDAEQAKSDERYQDSLKFRDKQAELASSRDDRADEKQNALLIGQALDRLSADYKESLADVDAIHLDPLTKQPINPEAYAAKVAEAKANMEAKRANIVQRSGLSADQINKYGFGMYLPEPTAGTDTGTDKTTTEIVTPPPAGFDKNKFDADQRAQGLADSAQFKPLLTPSEIATMTPEQQRQRIQDLNQYRQANPELQTQSQQGLLYRVKNIW
ncbi:hypothetical protein [Shewanella sp. Koi 1]